MYKINIKKDINIKYIELDNEQVTLENVKKSITKNTKVIKAAKTAKGCVVFFVFQLFFVFPSGSLFLG